MFSISQNVRTKKQGENENVKYIAGLISHRLEEEEVVLLCTAEANPEVVILVTCLLLIYLSYQVVMFVWEKSNTTFDGQAAGDTLESEVRLKIMNETVGEAQNVAFILQLHLKTFYRDLLLPCEQ